MVNARALPQWSFASLCADKLVRQRRITRRPVSFYSATPHEPEIRGQPRPRFLRHQVGSTCATQSDFSQPDQEERDQPCTSMLSPAAGSILARSWSLSNASNAIKNPTITGGYHDQATPQIQPRGRAQKGIRIPLLVARRAPASSKHVSCTAISAVQHYSKIFWGFVITSRIVKVPKQKNRHPA